MSGLPTCREGSGGSRRGFPAGGSRPRISRAPRPRRRGAGIALLEVVAALTIFVMAAAVVGSAMRGSFTAMRNARDSAKAASLAESILAELGIGMLELKDIPPTAFGEGEEALDPEEGWTYEVAVDDFTDSPGLKTVTVTVRREEGSRPVVCQLTQWIADPAPEALPGEEYPP